jgi:hypothetical protein
MTKNPFQDLKFEMDFFILYYERYFKHSRFKFISR